MFSKFLVNRTYSQVHFMHTCVSKRDAIRQSFTVTLLDAASEVGRNTALLLKQCPLISELRLHDKDDAVCVVAEDLSHIDTKTKVKSYCGLSVLKHAISDADLVVTVGGCRKRIAEGPKTLFEKNLDDVRSAALHCIEFNPKAILCIAKPLVEAFVPLVSEEFKKAGVYDHRKIIGITSIACMRANYFVGLISGKDTSEIRCPCIGGLSKNCLIACVSQSRPEKVHSQHHKLIQDSVAISEEEVLKAYKNESLRLTPALAITRFINAQLKALTGDSKCVDCAFVKQNGHIAQFLPYMMSVVRLGRHGILSTHMPKISGYEAHCLKKASLYIKDAIKLGESFVTGEQKNVKEEKKTIKQ